MPVKRGTISSERDKMNTVKKDVWAELSENKQPLIIYGMGNGADKILNELERLNIPVYGVMASDDFVRGQVFRKFRVKKLSDFEKEVSNPVIIVSFGTQRSDVINHILSLAEKHTVLALDVPVYGSNIFNMSFYKENESKIETLYNLLADEQSRKVLENEINFKLSGRLEYLTSVFTDKEEVFDNILQLGQNESYLDLGAYRGDTIQEFLRHTGTQYRHITALEPDKKTYKKLKEYAGQMNNIQLFNMGIWDSDCDLHFNAESGRGSSVLESGTQALAVTKIDTLYRKRTLSYLKIDVEGAEKQTLSGGIQTLQRDKPKINVAVYHRSEDIFELPLLLHSINPNYKLFLRQHPHIPAWDLNLYAI